MPDGVAVVLLFDINTDDEDGDVEPAVAEALLKWAVAVVVEVSMSLN